MLTARPLAWIFLFLCNRALGSDTGLLEQQASTALATAQADLDTFEANIVNYNTYGTSASSALLAQLDTVLADLRNLTSSVKLLVNMTLSSEDQTSIASAGLGFYNRYILFYQTVPLNATLLEMFPIFGSGLNAIQSTVIEGMEYTTTLVPASDTAQFESILATLQSEATNMTSVFNENTSSYQLPSTTAASTMTTASTTSRTAAASISTTITHLSSPAKSSASLATAGGSRIAVSATRSGSSTSHTGSSKVSSSTASGTSVAFSQSAASSKSSATRVDHLLLNLAIGAMGVFIGIWH